MESSTVAFAEDVSVSGHYSKTVRSRRVEAERKLMFAVLKDAILKYKKHRHSDDRQFREAERWFFEKDVDHVFSFEHICWILGLSANRIRRHLLPLQLS